MSLLQGPVDLKGGEGIFYHCKACDHISHYAATEFEHTSERPLIGKIIPGDVAEWIATYCVMCGKPVSTTLDKGVL